MVDNIITFNITTNIIPTIVKITLKIKPFFAICLLSSRTIKYITKPPSNPKNIGSKYHALLGFFHSTLVLVDTFILT